MNEISIELYQDVCFGVGFILGCFVMKIFILLSEFFSVLSSYFRLKKKQIERGEK